MDPDDLRKTWRAQTSRTRLTIDADVLIQEVRRNESALAASVFWRDVREVGISLLMVPVCVFLAASNSWSWPWYLMGLAMLWIAGFMIADRIRYRRKDVDAAAPLLEHVESSLRKVEHQIRLLRRVFWWYLLPPGAVLVIMFGQSLWSLRAGGWRMALGTTLVFSVIGLVMAGVCWLNRYAVRHRLNPRRRELQELLAALKQNAAGESF